MMKKIIILFAWALAAMPAFAQYYERDPRQGESSLVYAGFLVRDFQPRASNSLPDSLSIHYNAVMPILGYRQGPIDVMFGYTRFTLRGENKTAIFASVAAGNNIPLLFSPRHSFLLPLMISSDYSRSDNTGGDKENFNLGSVGIGAGLKYRFRGSAVEFSVQAVEAVHWSFEGFGTGSGFSAATMGEAVVRFNDVLVLEGIALGYRVRYQTWNMNNAKFDYASFSHGAFLGVMF